VAGNSDDTLVMYGGQVMEVGKTESVYADPTHPYTQGLMSAVPRVDSVLDKLVTIPGNPPNMMNMPAGCPFTPRCRFAIEKCLTTMPELIHSGGDEGHMRACNVPKEGLV